MDSMKSDSARGIMDCLDSGNQEWVTTDGDFFNDMLKKERKILQELLTLEEFAALEKAETEKID